MKHVSVIETSETTVTSMVASPYRRGWDRGKQFTMGNLEQLQRYFEGGESLSEDQLKDRLETLEQDIRRSWDSYKRHQWYMHGVEVRDSALRMALLYLIRKGIL